MGSSTHERANFKVSKCSVTDCPPIKLLSDGEVRDAIKALGHQRKYTDVLLVELLEEEDPGDQPSQSLGACASTSKGKRSRSAAYVSTEPTYPVYKDKSDRVSDHHSATYGLPNRGVLRDIKDYLTKAANLQLRPVSNFIFQIKF